MKQIDELIRGEMAAVRSFDAVLGKIKDESEVSQLRSLREDHVRARDTLKRFAGSEFSEDVQSSGAWGSFSSAFVSGSSLFGDKAAIQALKMGEEHGINEYRQALEDSSIQSELKDVIRSELLPQQEKHISLINSYLH